MARSPRRRLLAPELLRDGPTRERAGHDPIEIRTIEQAGRPHQVRQVASMAAQLVKAGRIEPGHADALLQFEALTEAAGLSGLQAVDWGRVGGGGRADLPPGNEAARRRLWRAVTALGGWDSLMGSFAVNVLGLGLPFEVWAGSSRDKRFGPVYRAMAPGLYAGAAVALAQHFPQGKQTP
jgi:hypothetical protein